MDRREKKQQKKTTACRLKSPQMKKMKRISKKTAVVTTRVMTKMVMASIWQLVFECKLTSSSHGSFRISFLDHE